MDEKPDSRSVNGASLITSEELERAKERIHLERKWDYSFMCALDKITGVVEQENTLTVGTPEYQELIQGFGRLIGSLCQALHSHARRGRKY